jgi:capsular polysaccharide biosynthesis protein
MLLASESGAEASPQNSAERLAKLKGREVLARGPYEPVDPKIAKLVIAAVVVVLTAIVVILVSLLQTPIYEASAEVLVKEKHGDQQTNLAVSGEMIQTDPRGLQTLALMMVHGTGSRPVAEEVIGRLGLRMEPAELLDNLTVEQVENTSFIVLTYEGNDPVEAQQIVNTVGEVASEFISETSMAGSKLTATVYAKAAVPENPVSPKPLRNGLLTLVIGLVLCAVYLVRMGNEARGS